MYGLTNFLSVLWYTVSGWFGAGHGEARAVTLFDGLSVGAGSAKATAIEESEEGSDEDAKHGGTSLDVDLRYTHPHGWGFDTRN